MKLFFILLFVHAYILYSQSDTLLINLKSGEIEKISVLDIKLIKFEPITSVVEQSNVYNKLALKGNYPNPFGEKTIIEFEITAYGNVEVIIYDYKGNQIQNLECRECPPGKNTLQWNSLDKNNNKVQTGVYYYEVRYNNEIQLKKMILVK